MIGKVENEQEKHYNEKKKKEDPWNLKFLASMPTNPYVTKFITAKDNACCLPKISDSPA